MEILSMNVVVIAIVDPWVTTLSFVVALAMRIQVSKATKIATLFFLSAYLLVTMRGINETNT